MKMHHDEHEDCSYTDELRESSNEPYSLNKGWRFNGDNSAMEIRRQQSGSVVMISRE